MSSPTGPVRAHSKAVAQKLREARETCKHEVAKCPIVQKEWVEGEILSIATSESLEITVTKDGKVWRRRGGNKLRRQLDDDWWRTHHPDWRRSVQRFVKDEGLGPLDEAMIMAKVAELPAWYPYKKKTPSRIGGRFHLVARDMIKHRRAGRSLAKVDSDPLPHNLVATLTNQELDFLES